LKLQTKEKLANKVGEAGEEEEEAAGRKINPGEPP